MPPEDEMPKQPKTIELPAMTDRALLEDLTRVVKAGFAEVRVMRMDVDLLVGDLASLKVDVRELQKWKIASEERSDKHSGGLQQSSSVNLKQDEAIATIIEEVAAVKSDVGDVRAGIVTIQSAVAENTLFTKQAIAGFFKTPLGVTLLSLAMAAAGYATNWLSSHGGH